MFCHTIKERLRSHFILKIAFECVSLKTRFLWRN